MIKSDPDFSFKQINRAKVKNIAELMQKLFREEDDYFNRIPFGAKHYESTRSKK